MVISQAFGPFSDHQNNVLFCQGHYCGVFIYIQNHDGDLVKYFDLVLTIPIHGYPYIYYRNQYIDVYSHGNTRT